MSSLGKTWSLTEEQKQHYKKPKSDEHKHKLSLTKLGDRNPMKNPIYAKRMADSKRGKPNLKHREFWKNNKEEQIRRMMSAVAHRPTKPEKTLIQLIEKYNLPYKYVGDWSLIIGGRNPDFINCNGSKKLIEVFGEYWHTVRSRESLQDRIDFFKTFGFDTMILWDYELKNESLLLDKIKKFGGN